MAGTITDLLGVYNILDFGVDHLGVGDAAVSINRAFALIGGMGIANGSLYFPPGTYKVLEAPIAPVDNIEIIGAGPATIFQLGADANIDVMQASGLTNLRMRNLRIDGNRANNTSGTRQGLWLYNVVDAWIENVEVINCRADGFRLDICERVELMGCRASNNGRHGFSLSYSQFCQLMAPRAYDNCQVASVGTGDGINLELLSAYNAIVGPVCYETALAGDRQGYGVREAAGEGCHHNLVVATALEGNRSGRISLESADSIAITPHSVRLLAALDVSP